MDISGAIVEKLVDLAKTEVSYLCCFKTYVEDFENKKILLDAKRRTLQKDVEDARNRNEIQIEDEVLRWIQEADSIFQEDTKTTKKCFFGWCPNCLWKYRRGKMLAQRIRDITDLIWTGNFDRVARVSELPGIKYYSSQNFIDFKSRKSIFQELVKALLDENCSMIGLYGMGGTGKTTLATQVGKQVEISKAFERVIFVVVSSPPDIRKIQFHIASQLELKLEEVNEEKYPKILWSRIASYGKRVLIILDDMWEELDLKDIGIPCGPNHGNCCVLITTRHSRVCTAMRCQRVIGLQLLTDRDALNLFVEHVGIGSNNSFSEFMVLAQEIVQQCGGLPIAVVAIATTLKNWPLRDWKIALETLKLSEPLHNVDEDMTKVYGSLKLSYDRLEESAQYVFLLCSLFPEGYEIPVDLLCKLSIGLGLVKEVGSYMAARTRTIVVKHELISSSLLLEAKEVYVKMHSVVREMALLVSDKDLQVIMDSSTSVKSHIRFLFWSRNDFPNQFDGTKLEVLVLWIKGQVKVEDSYAIFEEMARLRVLFLRCDSDHKYVPLSLKLLHPLKNIRTLILDGWKLGDMSVLQNLHDLEIIELTNCLINELPNEIRELKNLRSLGLRKCKIERNNPFEVIERCIQLEELDFVLNSTNIEDRKEEGEKENTNKVVPDISLPSLKKYCIACPHLKYFDHDDNGMLNCFNTENVKNLISNAMFKNFLKRAEVLKLGEIRGEGWKSLVPDIVPVEDGGMNDLIKLYLYSLVDLEYLVDNSNRLSSDVKVLSNLVELYLDGVDVKELHRGPMISGFLEQLEILKLRNCKKLHNIFFDRNLTLPHLKVLHLINCPMFQSSIFQYSSVARSLMQLEEIIISDFEELRRIITYESMGEEIVGVDSTLFPKLKTLEIEKCGKLELISPLLFDLPSLEAIIIRKCEELKYMFGEDRTHEDRILHEEIMFPWLEKMVLDDVPNFIALFPGCNIDMQRPAPILKFDSEEEQNIITARRTAFSWWAHVCCFLPRTKDTDIVVSNATLQDHTIISSELPAMKGVQTFHTVQCLLRRPFNLRNIRQMTIVQCSNLMSLFTVSIAGTIMLEKLTIQKCGKLKHVITNDEEEYDDHIDNIAIFPKLEELLIVDCRNMEFIFPSTSSICLQKLKFVIITSAPKLKYVFGRFGGEECLSNGNENKELCIDLRALETVSLTDVPNIIGFSINGRQLSLETAKNLTCQGAKESEIEEIINVERPMTSSVSVSTDVLNFHNLQEIKIIECRKMKVMFPASTWRSLSLLSKLCILNCGELVHVVDEDSKDYGRFSDNHILPKLECLQIHNCNKLKFIFPSSFLGGLQKLKYMIIEKAADLKYIFGKFHVGDYLSNPNENGKLEVDLPALETLSLREVPNIINIYAERYSVRLPSLQQIGLDNCQELTRDSPNLTVYLKPAKDLMKITMHERNLRNLEVGNSTINEVFNLEGAKMEGLVTLSLQSMVLKNLSELKQMCKGPKRILSLYNLCSLKVIGCKRLRTIFSISILKSLPQLFHLNIKDCEELVQIIEEDPKESAADDWLELGFPNLAKIHIQSCHRLKFLFSISTPNMFPKLERLEIDEASELEQIFTCKQDDTQKVVVNDAAPNLSCLRLIKLPKLVTIGWGIAFQTLTDHQVVDCPKYQAVEITSQQVQQELQNLDLDNQAATEEPLSAENDRKAMKRSVEEVPISNKSSEATLPSSSTFETGLSTGKTLKEIEAKEPTPALENQAFETSTAKSPPIIRVSLHELKAEQPMNETIGQLQHQDLGETKTSIEVPGITNIPLDGDDLKKIKPISETIMAHQQEQGEISASVIENIPRETAAMEPKLHPSTIDSEAGGSQSGPCTIIDKETGKDIEKAVPASKLPTTKTSQDSEVDGLKERAEQGFQENDKSKEDIISIQQKGFGLRSQTELSSDNSLAKELSQHSETGKEVVGIAITSEAPVTSTSSISKVDGMKETMGQCFQEYDASPEATIATQPADLEPRKQSKRSKTGNEAGGILVASQSSSTTSTNSEGTKEAARGSVDTPPTAATPFDSTVEQIGHASVEEEQKLENASKPNLPSDIPSLYHQSSQIGTASPSPLLGILEIFRLVKLKDGEAALLAQALEQYRQLLLPREQRPHQIIEFSYRVLVDILIMLENKTPCTITTSEKSTLEDKLLAATYLGFDKGWVDSVRAKVFDVDMSDVLSAQERIQAMESELETYDMMLKQVQKEKEEARRDLEMAQSKFDAIDSKLLGLLKDSNTLKANMGKLRNIISAKDTPFGI